MKNDNIFQLVGVVAIVLGILGFLEWSGAYIWLCLIGSIILIAKRKTDPKILSRITLVIAIFAIIAFIISLFGVLS